MEQHHNPFNRLLDSLACAVEAWTRKQVGTISEGDKAVLDHILARADRVTRALRALDAKTPPASHA